MKNSVSKEEVATFKEIYCDENSRIAKILKTQAQQYLIEPVLDVGAGNGDICYYSCPNKEVFLVDINNYITQFNPEKHKRYVMDFFDFFPFKQINTILISHTLQFIDEDIQILNRKIASLNAHNIILVLNENNDFMKKILDWTLKHVERANPEQKLPNFPQGYREIDKFLFKAELVCDNFSNLAAQVSYLMLFELTENLRKNLVEFLQRELCRPAFSINQAIYIYSK